MRLQVILPTVPGGQTNLKAARPQLRDHSEQCHVEVAAKKAGALELSHVCRQQVPKAFVGCRSVSQLSLRRPEMHVRIGDPYLIGVTGVIPINSATADSDMPHL